MKTNKIILAAAFAASVVSCQKDNLSENKATEPMTISTEVLTKTSLEGSEVHWSSDDVIAVFDNTDAKNEFTVSDTNGSNASFSGSVTTGTTQIYAVYPYVHAISANSGIIKVNVPSDQTSKAGSFAEEHNISVAKAQKIPGVEEVSGVTFKNACALLKFTVPSYISDMQKVTVSSNSVIAGEMTVDYSSETPAFSISEEGSKSISMTGEYEAGSTFWFVLAPVTLDGITVNVETAKGVYSMSASAQFEMTAGQYRNLGTLELAAASANSASAAHTYSNGMLTGTEVTVRLGIPSETSGYITALNLEVKNAAGVTVRTLSKGSASETETISPDQAWPYLPKGDYTVSGSYTLSGVTEKEIEAIAFSISESPQFTVTPGAYTSYTKYIDGDSATANSCQAETIYSLNSVEISISDEILNNDNYSAIKVAAATTLDGATTTAESISGQSWGNHHVSATYTFDGNEVTGQKDCYITGLPYTLNPAANDSEHGWQANSNGNVNWNINESVRIGYNLNNWGANLQTDITKAFNLPADINIIISSTGTACGSGDKSWFLDARVNTTFTLSVSDNSVYSYTTTNGGTEQSYSTGDIKATMSSATPTIKCHNSYSTASGCTKIKALAVNYGTR